MAVWIYWMLERQLFYGSDAATWVMLACFGVVNLAAGVLVARWWALLLPVLAVVLALPAGFPDANKGEPLPIWFVPVIFSPVAFALIGLGVAAANTAGRGSSDRLELLERLAAAAAVAQRAARRRAEDVLERRVARAAVRAAEPVRLELHKGRRGGLSRRGR